MCAFRLEGCRNSSIILEMCVILLHQTVERRIIPSDLERDIFKARHFKVQNYHYDAEHQCAKTRSLGNAPVCLEINFM